MRSRLSSYTFFTDRDLAPHADTDVGRILQDAGLSIEPHDKHFSSPVDDDVWLRLCGRNGWVGLTKDKSITYTTPIAAERIMTWNVPVFVLIGAWSHPRLARNFVNTIGPVVNAIERNDRGFIARVYMQTDDEKLRRGTPGSVREWLTYDQWEDPGE